MLSKSKNSRKYFFARRENSGRRHNKAVPNQFEGESQHSMLFVIIVFSNEINIQSS